MSLRSVIGIDVGGTKIAAARLDADSLDPEQKEKGPTNAHFTFDYVRGQILQCVSTLKKRGTRAIGIGVPGPVDAVSGRIKSLPNIPGAEGFDLAGYVHEHTGIPAVIANDANCFTLAEALLGAGRGERVVAGVMLGTGVGGGIVINGKLYAGSRGYAAEFGHMLLKPGCPPYPSANQRGEVEQFISGTAMGMRCEAAKNPRDYLAGDACKPMHAEIFEEIAWLVTSLTHAIDPGIIVFGGSAGLALKPHLPNIVSRLKKWMLPGIDPPKLAVSELEDAPLKGAALLALRAIGEYSE